MVDSGGVSNINNMTHGSWKRHILPKRYVSITDVKAKNSTLGACLDNPKARTNHLLDILIFVLQ